MGGQLTTERLGNISVLSTGCFPRICPLCSPAAFCLLCSSRITQHVRVHIPIDLYFADVHFTQSPYGDRVRQYISSRYRPVIADANINHAIAFTGPTAIIGSASHDRAAPPCLFYDIPVLLVDPIEDILVVGEPYFKFVTGPPIDSVYSHAFDLVAFLTIIDQTPGRIDLRLQ